MNKPITETEFRLLVELRRAVGEPYEAWNQIVMRHTLESWVEFFASGLDYSNSVATFEVYVNANYDDILQDRVFTPDHPEEHYENL